MGFLPQREQFDRILPGIRKLLAGAPGSTRTRIGAGFALMAVCTVISLQCNPQVASKNVPGLVLEIDALGIQPPETGQPHARVLIAVGDTTQMHILLPPPIPRPGHFIPLVAAHFRKGNIEYSLDQEKWLLEGPS